MTSRSIHHPWLGVLILLPAIGFADTPLTPQPLAKVGPCPSGYTTSGAYCRAGQAARPAYPAGWSKSDVYCLRNRP